jgi:hypothetical protein
MIAVCGTQILEDKNFLHCIVFTHEVKFHISGSVNRHNCVIWGSEPPGEHSEHERDSHKVNVWSVLTNERVTGPFFFDEYITTLYSFLACGELCSSKAEQQQQQSYWI